jgi:simple sugar transport system substrate-binding protein/basic membrane protein A
MTRTARKAFVLAGFLILNCWLPQAIAQGKAAVLLPGSINDQSWNALGYGVVIKLKSMGFDTAYSENVQPADYIEALKDFARRGYSPVIGHTGRFLSAAQRVGPDFPNVQFIVDSGSGGAGKNVGSLDYDNAHVGYLMGVLAARLTKTGKVGSVNGLEGLPNVVAQVGGFRQGVKATRPDVEVRVLYIKDMEDPAMAKEAALALISGGADFVFGKLNAGQNGIIQAAAEKKVFATGRSFGHVEAAPQTVAAAIIERWDEMHAAAAKDVREGKFFGELKNFGYDAPSGPGADLMYSKDRAFNPAVPAAAAADVEAAKKRLASKQLVLKVSKEDARGGI